MSGGIWAGTSVSQSVESAIRYYPAYGFDA